MTIRLSLTMLCALLISSSFFFNAIRADDDSRQAAEGLNQTIPVRALWASADVHIDGGRAVNEDYLRCSIGTRDVTPGIALVKFDISGMDIRGDLVAVLTLKAVYDRSKGGQPVGIALATLGSNWTESSTQQQMETVLAGVKKTIKSGDINKYEAIRFDRGDRIFSFDVSRAVRAAAGTGAKSISFALIPLHDAEYRVDFNSRETDEGPVLLVTKFPIKAISPPLASSVQADSSSSFGNGSSSRNGSTIAIRALRQFNKTGPIDKESDGGKTIPMMSEVEPVVPELI